MKHDPTLNIISIKFTSLSANKMFWPQPNASGEQWLELLATRMTIVLDQKSSALSQWGLAVYRGIWPDLAPTLMVAGPVQGTDGFGIVPSSAAMYRTSLTHDARTTGSYSTLLKEYEVAPPGLFFNSFTVAGQSTTGAEKAQVIMDFYVRNVFFTTGELAFAVKAQGGSPQRR